MIRVMAILAVRSPAPDPGRTPSSSDRRSRFCSGRKQDLLPNEVRSGRSRHSSLKYAIGVGVDLALKLILIDVADDLVNFFFPWTLADLHLTKLAEVIAEGVEAIVSEDILVKELKLTVDVLHALRDGCAGENATILGELSQLDEIFRALGGLVL
jgi:hypothetical protein